MNYNRLYFSFLITLAINACFSIPILAHGVTRDGGDRIKLTFLSRYHAGDYGQGAAEIVSYDPASQLAFITNGFTNSVDAISLAKPESPVMSFSIDLKEYGYPNSVAVKNNLVAVAVENKNPQANGSIVVFNTKGKFLNKFTTGPMPDMVTFSPNAKHILVANEGEPNDSYTIDPEGSITIIDLTGDIHKLTQKNVRLASFKRFKKTH